MGLPRSGEPEREHVDGTVEKASRRQPLELLLELDRQTRPIERLPGLAGGELRSSAQAIDPSLTAVAGFELEDLEECRERRAMIGGLEARNHFRSNRRQTELGTQLRDPFLGRHAHRATSASRAS